MPQSFPRRWHWLALLFLLGAGSPIRAATVRCTTYEEKTLKRLQTICDDGTRAVSRYNTVLERWETTITQSPQPSCVGRVNPRTQQVEVRCR